jgi:hypothetical protein
MPCASVAFFCCNFDSCEDTFDDEDIDDEPAIRMEWVIALPLDQHAKGIASCLLYTRAGRSVTSAAGAAEGSAGADHGSGCVSMAMRPARPHSCAAAVAAA